MKLPLPIRTKRLVIRQFLVKDLPAYLEFMLDLDSTKYLAFTDEQKTEQGATDLFNFVTSSYNSDNIVHAYAIALAESDEYIGSCGFSPYENKIYECYYSINSPYRRKGYAVEAMTALFQALSALGKIAEIRAYSSEENLPSLNLAQKLGMKYQGKAVHAHSGLAGVVYSLEFN
ncbi:MAG: GNAT family N-acetyltransferase [Oscillatoria sp. PMC 1051.18]|nr:GNAT family N-acetyltransferase [Oscillatoria sp. PMC 1050.18]MEC5032332.1 GNAT family N-acetyltransferase [Oscillatoria sp. PMC 1051.18]